MSKWNDDVERQRARRLFAPFVAEGTVVCGYCHKPILPGDNWHVAHSKDRRSVAPWHAKCNQQEAQLKSAKTRSLKRPQEEHPGKRG